jgi:capsular exopolysaccharide synthesis family protein
MIKKAEKKEDADVGLLEDASTPAAQAVLRLQTDIDFASVDKKVQCYAITSAEENAGKSTTAGNLAVMYAQRGLKILLIDMDIRRPTQYRLFGVSNKVGIVDYITGVEDDLTKVIKKVKDVDLITAGAHTPFPSKIIESDKMIDFIKKMRKAYDYIIIDTPPLQLFPDAMQVNKLVDGYIFVAAQHLSKKAEIVESMKSMADNGLNIIGIVIDRVTERDTHSSYYYGKSSYYDSSYYYYNRDEDDKPAEKK